MATQNISQTSPKVEEYEIPRPQGSVSFPSSDETQATCPGTSYGPPTEYCCRGVRNAFGQTIRMSSNHSPSCPPSGPSSTDDYVTDNDVNFDETLTMPQLKRMRQTSMSIIRRTRMSQCWNDCSASAVYNPAYEANEEEREKNRNAVDSKSREMRDERLTQDNDVENRPITDQEARRSPAENRVSDAAVKHTAHARASEGFTFQSIINLVPRAF